MSAASVGLDATQYGHAATIVGVVRSRNLPQRAAVIAIETGLVESTLHVYANSNVPDSLSIPNEGVGSDHASVGIFQQQVPSWGTTADCMDPAKSCGKFLDRLVAFDWQSMPTGQAAQTVQVSAFPDRYQQQEGWATQIVNDLWASTSPDSLNSVPLSVPLSLLEDPMTELHLNGGDGQRSGFWLNGGRAIASLSNADRKAWMTNGTKPKVWATTAEFARVFKEWSR